MLLSSTWQPHKFRQNEKTEDVLHRLPLATVQGSLLRNRQVVICIFNADNSTYKILYVNLYELRTRGRVVPGMFFGICNWSEPHQTIVMGEATTALCISYSNTIN